MVGCAVYVLYLDIDAARWVCKIPIATIFLVCHVYRLAILAYYRGRIGRKFHCPDVTANQFQASLVI